uniref:Rhabdomeric opsin 2 n=1 Tax=Platynereis dumerilii TaxID=6359 RepID=A0A0K0YBF1_PLADU|nr:rhabdomeric opsin 2 [Platynereis dumerilii]
MAQDDSESFTAYPEEGDTNNITLGDLDLDSTLTVPYLENGLFFHPHWRKYRQMLENVPDSVHYILGIYITFVGFAGVIGNAIVIFVFTATKSLRTPSNMFIVNLAMSDLGFSLVNGFPLMSVSSFMRKWYFGRVGCILYGTLSGVFGLTSINTLALIAFDRFYVIQFPLRAIRTVTRTRSFVQICLVWIWATFWSCPPLFGWGRYIPEGLQTSCGFDFLSQDPLNRAFNYCIFSCGFVLPVTFAICSYCGILATVSMQAKHMEKIKQTKGGQLNDDKEKEKKQQIRLAKIAAGTISLFIISWMPYALLVILSTSGYRHIMTPYVCQIPSVFAKASAIWNPFVYSISHPKYRQALQERFPWLLCNKKDTDDVIELGDKKTRKQSLDSENLSDSTISESSKDSPKPRKANVTPTPASKKVVSQAAFGTSNKSQVTSNTL